MSAKEIVELIVGVMTIVSTAAFIARAFFRLDAIERHIEKKIDPHMENQDLHLEKSAMTRIEKRFDLIDSDVHAMYSRVEDLRRSIDQTHGRLDTVTAQLGIILQNQNNAND